MKHVKILGAALVFCLMAGWLLRSSKTAAVAADEGQGDSSTQPSRELSAQWQQNEREEARLAAQRIQELEKIGRHRAQLETAASNMNIFREMAQVEATPRWKQVVADHREDYRALLAKAMNSPRGETDCTICDGKSYMPCVMCKNRDGKCVTCRGSGHLNQNTLCPSCLGGGKCYLCTGSGKMFCPFCNDGVIEARGKPPSSSPPLE